MTNMVSKLCACLCFAGAIAVVAPACGPSGGDKESCEEGQQRAVVNGQEGCYDECDNGMCGGGFECQQGLCVAQTTPNGTPNNTNGMPNNTNGMPNNTNGMPNNTNGMPNSTTDYTQQCEAVAEILFGNCWDTLCTGIPAETQTELDSSKDEFLNGSAEVEACAQRASSDTQFATAIEDFAANVTCADTQLDKCESGFVQECGCTPPSNIGGECAMPTDCQGGDLQGSCIPATDANSQPTGWEGGYCIAQGCGVPGGVDAGFAYPNELCGAGNICLVDEGQQAGSLVGLCLDGCTSNSDCRTGYACQIAGLDVNDSDAFIYLQGCFPSCSVDTDCGTMGHCNTTTGQCETTCTDENLGGDPANGTWREVCQNTGGSCATVDNTEYCTIP